MEAKSWRQLEQDNPGLAAFGASRIDGKVAYMATLQDSGWPRAQPVTPIIGHGRCFVFVDPDSRKAKDLKRSGKFSLHCGMSDSSGSSGEFQMTGTATLNENSEVRLQAESVSNFRPAARSLLFELLIHEVQATSYRGGRPDRQRWHSGTTETVV
ncbi:MAG: pyridoxamine 5'-phosphate oxidase family protein [Pseudomonadales bacterium]|nr:pyridoxamine 5'-phosphate oxidase family protein [Pseudomonadales bacterium]